MPDWYLVGALRAVWTYCRTNQPTDEQLLTYWQALMAAAPPDE